MSRSFTAKASLIKSYGLAEKIMKDRAASFYQAFRHLPKERFQGVAALYAFCRYADDTVDRDDQGQQKGQTLESLNRLEQKLWLVYGANQAENGSDGQELLWWPAFEDIVSRFEIPIDSFLRQIDGQRMDAAFEGLRTIEELVAYGRLVAGSVGTMMLPLLAADESDRTEPEFIKACENLGVGMQITNILRDVGEDLRTRRRLYIPEELLIKHGVPRYELEQLALNSDGALPEAPIPDGFIQLWEELAQLADTYYQAYEKWIFWFHPTCQISLVAAALIYRAIGDAVRAESYNCFTKRCYTDAKTRSALIIEAGKRVCNRSQTLLNKQDRFY